jgi:hypothetical protein
MRLMVTVMCIHMHPHTPTYTHICAHKRKARATEGDESKGGTLHVQVAMLRRQLEHYERCE